MDSVIHIAEASARTNFVQCCFTVKLFCFSITEKHVIENRKSLPMKKYSLFSAFHKVPELFRFLFDFMSCISCVSKGAIFTAIN